MTMHHRRSYHIANIARRGFTLLELLVVIAIIVLVVAITIPALGGARDVARATSTKALMTEVSASIGQYRNDNADQLPGYFSQVELGSANNASMLGLTAMENALLDLAGANAINNGTNLLNLDPAGTGGIDVGLDLLGTGDNIYLDITGDNFVTQDNQVGIPDLVDAFGQPILLWAEDPGASNTPVDIDDVAAIDSEGDRARFYWNTNAAFVDAALLGKEQSEQRALSLLSSATGNEQAALAAITGDPGSPSPITFTTAAEVLPGSSRGGFVLQSAGRDGVYVSSEDRGASGLGLAYGANFFKDEMGTRLTDDANNPVSEDVLEGFNDLIISGR